MRELNKSRQEQVVGGRCAIPAQDIDLDDYKKALHTVVKIRDHVKKYSKKYVEHAKNIAYLVTDTFDELFKSKKCPFKD